MLRKTAMSPIANMVEKQAFLYGASAAPYSAFHLTFFSSLLTRDSGHPCGVSREQEQNRRNFRHRQKDLASETGQLGAK
jgi:hypothetical protein